MIYNFEEFNESLDTNSWKWVKSNAIYKKSASFRTTANKLYYMNFDEVKPYVYNIYFYLYDDSGTGKTHLTNTREEFQVLGNVKNCIHEFLDEYRVGAEFICFISTEKERVIKNV